jgi:hypothetical protein
VGGAAAAHGETPRVPRKPGELEGELALEAASRRNGETPHLEQMPRRIEQGVGVLAADLKPVPLTGHGLAAGAAEQKAFFGFLEHGTVLLSRERTADGSVNAPKTLGRQGKEHAEGYPRAR